MDIPFFYVHAIDERRAYIKLSIGMEEKIKITRLVKKRLEGHFNKEIIEREFDPSGNGLHATTPLVADLELAYLAAIDKPFRTVSKRQKMHTRGKQDKERSLTDTVTPRTKMDTKLKGRAQWQDVTRLSKNSEITLNGLSISDIIDVHRFRCQGVPFEHTKKGKVPHVSHHVRAYLNAGEALRYSRERDERKLAREYKARCGKSRGKNLPNGNQRDARGEMHSPKSSLIDFRHVPLTAGPVDCTVGRKPDKPNMRTRITKKKNSTEIARFEPTCQLNLQSDSESQTSSVREFSVRKESGTLPSDLGLSSKDEQHENVTTPDRSSETNEDFSGHGGSGEPTQMKNPNEEGKSNVHLESEKREMQMKRDGGKQEAVINAADNMHSDSQAPRSDGTSFTPASEESNCQQKSESDSIRINSVKDYKVRDSEYLEVPSGLSDTNSSTLGSPSGVRRKGRPQTASRRSKESSDEPRNHSQSRTGMSSQNSVDSSTTASNSDVHAENKTEDNDGRDLDLRSEGSHGSIGDASSLIDEPSIKSLSLQDTFSGSYSLDFEDDDESSAFDTVSYHSRTRSKSGFISIPNEIGISGSRRSASRSSDRTEEYIRTESVLSLR